MTKKLVWVTAVIFVGTFLYQKNEADPLWIPSLFGLEKKGFASTNCWFGYKFKRQTECGYLYVLEDYRDLDSRTLRLPVVIFKAANSSENSIPLLFLQGGPRPAYLDENTIGWTWEDYIRKHWLKNRDVILIDYRGIGLSRPELKCDNFLKNYLKAKTTNDRFNALRKCQNDISQLGLDLKQYHALSIVDDLKFLRQSLKIDIWDIWGTSYGSLIALLLTDNDTKSVRSVIAEGVFPARYAKPFDTYSEFLNLVDYIFENCKNNNACNQRYPNAYSSFEELILRLKNKSINVSIKLWDRNYEIAVNDINFIDVIFFSLYKERNLNFLPRLVNSINSKNYKDFAQLLETYMAHLSYPWASVGALITFNCNDSGTKDIEKIKANPNVPGWAKNWLIYPDVCPNLISENDSYVLKGKKINFDTPVLFISGRLDPATPYKWTMGILTDFSNSQMVLFSDLAHNTSSNWCSDYFKEQFINTPFKKIETKACKKTIYFSNKTGLEN